MGRCRELCKSLRRSCRERVAEVRAITAHEALRWLFLKKCCCCIPRRVGVGLLIVIQMTCLMPYTIIRHYTKDNTWVFATALIVLMAATAIVFTWGLIYEYTGALPICVYISCGNVFFHFTMLNQHYAQHKRDNRQHKDDVNDMILLVFSIIGIVSYFYLVFMLYNVYVKLKLLEDPQQDPDHV